MSDFQTEKVITARRQRGCPECGSQILPGQRYAKETGCWDGDFYSAVMCLPCKAFADRYVLSMRRCSMLNADEVSYTFGDIINEAAEFAEFDRPDGQSLPASRDAVMAMFDQIDADERAYQIRERENARRARAAAERRHAEVVASLRMLRGMERCSAIPYGPPFREIRP